MKKILIVEDNDLYYNKYRRDLKNLENEILLLIADQIDDAWKLFDQNSNVDVIVMDYEMGNEETPDLVRRIRKAGYIGPIIANSNASECNEILLKAGCDIKRRGDKFSAIAGQLLTLLEIDLESV